MARVHPATARSSDNFTQTSHSSAAATIGNPTRATTAKCANNRYVVCPCSILRLLAPIAMHALDVSLQAPGWIAPACFEFVGAIRSDLATVLNGTRAAHLVAHFGTAGIDLLSRGCGEAENAKQQ